MMTVEQETTGGGNGAGWDRPRPALDSPALNTERCPPVAEAPQPLASGRPGLRDTVHRRPLAGRRRTAMLIPFAVVCVLAVLFVAWETAFRRLLPSMSVGWHHALLTWWAGVVTAAACTGVYAVMHWQHRKLSEAAERLTRLLESYKANPCAPDRFENPCLVHCKEELDCKRTECPMYDSPGERCWQVVALGEHSNDDSSPSIDIQQCHECRVYRRSCPDALTVLGEGFNNLMFLLEEEAKHVGRMQKQMLEKEKMVAIGQMASGIAHEVGNPLSSISSIVQMVRRAQVSPPVAKQLGLIETHIQRISSTVRQLVSLARPGAEQWELVDLGQTVLDAVRLISFDRRARNVEIEFEPPGSLPQTYALRGQVQQVFINLALNALDVMPDGGELRIDIRKVRRELVVRLSDTGWGIAPEQGSRIFEPFFTTKEPGQGTGLGLSVSYGIIQKHGGTIEFTSTPGKGTTFAVHIPIWDRPPDA